MLGGYVGKVLNIDLTTNETFSEEVLKKHNV